MPQVTHSIGVGDRVRNVPVVVHISCVSDGREREERESRKHVPVSLSDSDRLSTDGEEKKAGRRATDKASRLDQIGGGKAETATRGKEATCLDLISYFE